MVRQIIIFLFFIGFAGSTATLAQPNDCEGAVVICDNGPVAYTPIGPGNQDLDANSSTDCGTSEHQSAWYYFAFSNDMPPGSILEFTITPNNGVDDYDFAVWGPDVECGNLGVSIRCNFSPIGITGLVVGGGGPAFEEALTVNPGEGYYLLVDNFISSSNGFSLTWGGSAAPFLDCNAMPGCDLEADAGPDATACPGDPFDLDGSATGSNGAETYQWTSIPPDAVNYLDDPASASTSGVLPTDVTGDIIYILETVEEDCESTDTVEVILLESVDPTFNFDLDYCEADPDFVLPGTSANGYSGSWDPAVVQPSVLGPGMFPFQFAIDPGQGNCLETFDLVITIEGATEPGFDLPETLCESGPPIVLPVISENGILGNWSPPSIDPEGLGGTEVMAEFNPQAGSCATVYNWTIQIEAAVSPTFDPFEPLCETGDPFILPTVSVEGYTGSWDIPIVDPAAFGVSVVDLVFTPDPLPGQCLAPFATTIEIAAEEEVEVPPTDPLCETDPPYVMPTNTSDGQYFGTWIQPVIDPAGQGGEIILNTFTVDPSFGECFTEVEEEIEIIASSELIFDILPICESEGPFLLPETTIDGVTGVWNPQVIDPAGQGGTEIEAIFTPDPGFCAGAESFFWPVENTIAPQFDPIPALCQSADIYPLPLVSNDGYQGTWNLPEIDPEGLGGVTLNLVFTPDPGQGDCLEAFETQVDILLSGIPEFEAFGPLCENASAIPLPETSLNGVTGQWTPATLDPADAADGLLSAEFMPDGGDCFEPVSIEEEVIPLPELLSITASDPSNCGLSDGSIQLEADGEALEYSIDGGASWQSSPAFDGLDGGQYVLQVRSSVLTGCAADTTVVLESPGAPRLDSVILDDPTICGGSDGAIQLQATGTDLEYSNDGGSTWQAESRFTGLPEGSFVVAVRSAGLDSCLTKREVTLRSPPAAEILAITAADPTECEVENGQISLEASGSNLTYSLNGGAVWQDSSLFSGLAEGDYSILVRSGLVTGCADTAMATLVAPERPVIQNIEGTDPSDCGLNDGQISVDASGGAPEYSIDGGNSWQAEPDFPGLEGGIYTVRVREQGTTTCTTQGQVELVTPGAPAIEQVYSQGPTDCGIDDGTIAIAASPAGADLEYSINAGSSYQSDSVFTQLPAGMYNIAVRSASSPSCRVTATAELTAPAPPVLDGITGINPADCGSADGTLEVSATGTDLEYSIDAGSSWQGSPSFTGLPEGEFEILVRIAGTANCVVSDQVTLTAPVPPVINEVIVTPESDCGAMDAGLEVISTDTGLEYSFNGGLDWQEDPVLNGLPFGTYDIRVRRIAATGCSDETEVVIPDVPCDCSGVSVEASATDAACAGDADGSVAIEGVSGIDDYSFEWIGLGEQPSQSGLATGWYRYRIRYKEDCELSDSVFVDEPDPISFELQSTPPDCEGSASGTVRILAASGGTGTTQFSLDGGSYTEQITYPGLAAGDYTVTARDDNGCLAERTVSVEAGPVLEVELEPAGPVFAGESVLLSPISDLQILDSFRWTANGLLIPAAPFELEASPQQTTTYEITVFKGSCMDFASVTVAVERPDFYIPSAFSPNGDGENDLFQVYSRNGTGFIREIAVFNRWGGLLHRTGGFPIDDPTYGWDGESNGRPMPVGVYVYSIVLVDGAGREHRLSGDVSLIR